MKLSLALSLFVIIAASKAAIIEPKHSTLEHQEAALFGSELDILAHLPLDLERGIGSLPCVFNVVKNALSSWFGLNTVIAQNLELLNKELESLKKLIEALQNKDYPQAMLLALNLANSIPKFFADFSKKLIKTVQDSVVNAIEDVKACFKPSPILLSNWDNDCFNKAFEEYKASYLGVKDLLENNESLLNKYVQHYDEVKQMFKEKKIRKALLHIIENLPKMEEWTTELTSFMEEFSNKTTQALFDFREKLNDCVLEINWDECFKKGHDQHKASYFENNEALLNKFVQNHDEIKQLFKEKKIPKALLHIIGINWDDCFKKAHDEYKASYFGVKDLLENNEALLNKYVQNYDEVKQLFKEKKIRKGLLHIIENLPEREEWTEELISFMEDFSKNTTQALFEFMKKLNECERGV